MSENESMDSNTPSSLMLRKPPAGNPVSFTFVHDFAKHRRQPSKCLPLLVRACHRRVANVNTDMTAANTIRMLVATDNHVGYNERDAIRGDDSWKSFHEIMCLAKERDVDMVLLAGDLFHENKPSRKAMYQVMRSLRMNCFGDKPCELEILNDDTETFQGQVSVGPASSSLTFAGHSRMQTTQMTTSTSAFPCSRSTGIMMIRQAYVKSIDNEPRCPRLTRSRNAYTETNYLPENYLPEFMDLVVWGHEHECLIEPRYNAEMQFHVMQPGSSVATSLAPGEAVSKHVAIVSIEGKKFRSEKIPLKTVRPFVMKEINLIEERGMKELAKKENNRTQITRHLEGIVKTLIEEAREQWKAAQGSGEDGDAEEPSSDQIPLPLIRLRVDYTAPEGSRFDCENPQRFSNRFVGKVANVNDVVQFHRKKAGARRNQVDAEVPEQAVLAQLTLDNVKVEKLVREFLEAQALTILPQNSFGDAVSQFVDKDDKHAMEIFVSESLSTQIKHLVTGDGEDEDAITKAMDRNKARLEKLFAEGLLRNRARTRPAPEDWDSDLNGSWLDQPGSIIRSDDEPDDDAESVVSVPARGSAARGRGRGRAARSVATGRKATAAKSKSRAKPAVDEEEDVVMLDDDSEEEEPVAPRRRVAVPAKSLRGRLASATPAKQSTTVSATKRASKQSQLNFSQLATRQPAQTSKTKAVTQHVSEDEISDGDDDAFEPAAAPARKPRR
ncbi:hypothetical protein MRB53_042238 [Persea americana]|nr:hypothetical protein MRB53_042238 [Persea americana]